jgi:hypothetical protein
MARCEESVLNISLADDFRKTGGYHKMKETRIDKGMKLRLNKRTVVHLDPRQMAQVGSGGVGAVDEQSVVICNTTKTEQPLPSVQVCPTCTTHDTGIPPYGGGNRYG